MFPNTDEWAKAMAIFLIDELQKIGIEKYKISSKIFSTVFLAGSPWAGKTEWIDSFGDKEKYIILDTDEYRKRFEWYNGANADEFQMYASRVMDKMFAFCMKNQLNVIVDGTFGNKNIIKQNIEQCIRRNRIFMVALVLQNPIISYLYTKKRELEKTRKVPTQAFIDKFFSSMDNVRFVLEEYPEATVLLTHKNMNLKEKGKRFENIFIGSVQQFDKKTKKWYSLREQICDLISEIDGWMKVHWNKFLQFFIELYEKYKKTS